MAFWRVVSAAFVVVSPLVLYVALTRMRLELAAWLIAGWFLLRMIPSWLAAPREHLREALRLPLCALVFAVLGAIAQNQLLLLAMPALTQLGFAWTFLSTLRAGQMPLLQRFAHMQKAHLDPDEIAHCRSFTWVWGLALILAAIASMLLAAFAPTWLWAAFAGAGAYAAIAVLFAVEYVVRSVRFRHHRDNVLQRALLRVWS